MTATLFLCSQGVEPILYRTHPTEFFFYSSFIVILYIFFNSLLYDNIRTDTRNDIILTLANTLNNNEIIPEEDWRIVFDWYMDNYGSSENEGKQFSTKGLYYNHVFSYEEIDAMINGVRFLKTLDTTAADMIIKKITENLTTKFYTVPTGISRVRETLLADRDLLRENLFCIQKAIEKGKKIRFTFNSYNKNKKLEKDSDDEITPSRTYETLNELISELKSRQPVTGNYVMLGVEYIEDGERTIFATVFDIDEINDMFKIYPELENVSDSAAISISQIKNIIGKVNLPIQCAYELIEWNEILGFGMDEQNAERCGKANLLADILFEMTFFGFDENKVNKAREEMNKRIEEFEEFTSLPVEEQVEYLTSAQEQTERPKIAEEAPEEREQFLREKFATLQNIYFALRDYREHIFPRLS